jgi:hypothetical protein
VEWVDFGVGGIIRGEKQPSRSVNMAQCDEGVTSALDGSEWSASCACRFTPSYIAPSNRWIGSWVALRTSLNAV